MGNLFSNQRRRGNMKIIFTVYILIKVWYPSNDIDDIRFINKAIHEAMSAYCFLGVEYDLTFDENKADLEIYPVFDFFNDPTMLGLTTGNYLYNPKVFGVPKIRMSGWLNRDIYPIVLKHELFHFFGGQHSIDTVSLMFPVFTGRNREFTRHDSLVLYNLFNLKY